MTIEQYKKARIIVSEMQNVDKEIGNIESYKLRNSVKVRIDKVEFGMSKQLFKSSIAKRMTTLTKRKRYLESQLEKL